MTPKHVEIGFELSQSKRKAKNTIKCDMNDRRRNLIHSQMSALTAE